MEIFKFIGSNLYERYAHLIAIHDMKKCNINVGLLKHDNNKYKLTKEKAND